MVKLYDADTNVLLDTVVTDSNGLYEFEDLPPGNYYLIFDPVDGTEFSPPNQGGDPTKNSKPNQTTGRTPTINLGSGESNLNQDAGMIPLASIGDRVWLDTNANGIQESGEPGLAGVTVKLLDKTGTQVLATTTTNANGNYLFSNLAPDLYVVEFVLPGAGYYFSPKLVGGNPAIDSDADPNTGRTNLIELDAGEDDLTVDAGIYTPPNLEIVKKAGSQRTTPGGRIEYTIFYSNTGLGDATGVVIQETVPEYTTFDQSTSDNGWSCPNGSPAGTVCEYNVGTVFAGARGTPLRFSVIVDEDVPSTVFVIRNEVVIDEDGNQGTPPGGGSPEPALPVDTPIDRPTVVELDSFTATPVENGVLVEWVTRAEIDTRGFFVKRGTVDSKGDVTDMAVISDLILGQGNQGGSYSYLDQSVVPGITYIYVLLEEETGGVMNEYTSENTTVKVSSLTHRIYVPLVTR